MNLLGLYLITHHHRYRRAQDFKNLIPIYRVYMRVVGSRVSIDIYCAVINRIDYGMRYEIELYIYLLRSIPYKHLVSNLKEHIASNYYIVSDKIICVNVRTRGKNSRRVSRIIYLKDIRSTVSSILSLMLITMIINHTHKRNPRANYIESRPAPLIFELSLYLRDIPA